jgi:hypothetical protein
VLRLRSPAERKRANCALEPVYVGILAARITNLHAFVTASPNRNFVAAMRGAFCGLCRGWPLPRNGVGSHDRPTPGDNAGNGALAAFYFKKVLP